ncbi:pyridoxamine 5'-phosphate oxidase family protein [Flavilitoribacter nigricans]|uniref:Pyridoxamine 5-phosphate oxidase n=1 Tax=Flavilitoribacter nigricans (strain ATCC 23147 / DSM 23189 / NBRC 102662 / NCIMB 1420 / SS-2) TaxID=1122177 RepID=A0A2D0N6J4_FLAN2|nr:pyridoxamine 5'-phosphate oxidase family protein [Flavilitoribacter nigricans]PHN04152.1 pyridoxamine 5-phosphate oxidase [Flavilitoribacter nigricans DSM 23189 = NBRC 102662]
MPKPQAAPVDPSRLPELAAEVIRKAKFPMLATVDGDQPRVRPVSPVRVDGFTVYIANLRSYQKTDQIAANPQVELCYLEPDHDQVRISGRAEVVTDRALIEEIWQANRLLGHYLGSMDNPEFILYRVIPERVTFMREWALEYWEVPLP